MWVIRKSFWIEIIHFFVWLLVYGDAMVAVFTLRRAISSIFQNLPILEPINELMEPSFTTTVSIPIPETTKNFETEILLPADQEPATVINPPPKKLKLRKIAVNTRGLSVFSSPKYRNFPSESHFFKLRSDDSKKVKRRLIKEQQKFGEDFQETFKSLKEEQKNGTKREGVVKPRKEKKPILSGETWDFSYKNSHRRHS